MDATGLSRRCLTVPEPAHIITPACKSIRPIFRSLNMRGRGGTGRRAGLKNLCPQGRVGSIPTVPTFKINHLARQVTERKVTLHAQREERLVSLARKRRSVVRPDQGDKS